MKIKISAKSLKQNFHRCDENYIKNVCKGRCCQGTKRILITVHPIEKERIIGLGAKVENNFIVPICNNLCPFKNNNGLCSIHYEPKPFGCKASPFTLSKNDVLIVRNRYRMLKCYKDKSDPVPAYENFYLSLKTIFGEAEANKIVDIMRNEPISNFEAEISEENYKLLKENDIFKKNII